MANFKLGYGLIERLNSTASSGGNLALANNSATYQRITGTAAHTVTLPQANAAAPNNCPLSTEFMIMNRSTDVVTVNAFGGGLLKTLAPNTQAYFRLTNNSTSAGTWTATNESGGGGGAALTADEKLGALAGLANSLFLDDETNATQIKVNPEEIGGNFWLTKPVISSQRKAPGNATLNGFLYTTGGNTTGVTTVERYSDDGNYWLPRQAMATARGFHAAFSDESNVFVCGGFSGGSETGLAEKYDDSTNTWSAITALGFDKAYLSSSFFNGLGYAVGGYKVGQGFNQTQAYSPITNAWYQRTVLPVEKYNNFSFASSKNLWIGAGATSPGTSQSTVYLFDDVLNSWNSGPPTIASTLQGCAGFSVMGRGYQIGGATTGVTGLAESKEFDFEAKVWKSLADMPAGAFDINSAAAPLNGVGYRTGGSPNNASTTDAMYSHIPFSFFQVPLSKKSTGVPTSLFVAAALNAVATSVPVRLRTDGSEWKYFEANKDGVLKLGESVAIKFAPTHPIMAAGGDGTATSETWSHTTNTWQQRQSMISVRGGGFQFNLEGKGYVGGGNVGGGVLSEKFDDIANTWTATASLPASRTRTMGHTLNGFGYCYSTSGTPTNTQFKYNSSLNSWSTPPSNYGAGANGYALGYSLLGRGYILGGDDGFGVTFNQNLQYDDILDTFVNKTNVHNVEQGGSVSYEGRGYVVGGFYSGIASDINTVAAYDPGTNAWTTKASLGSATRANRCDVIDGLIHSMGGNNSPTAHFRYNPYANVWSGSLTAMSASREYIHTPMGGYYRNYQLQVGLPTYLAALGGGQWVSKAAMTTGTGYGNAASIGTSMFTIAGFSTASGGNRDSIVQKYDFLADFWLRETPYPISVSGNGGISISTVIGGQAFTAAGDNGGFFSNAYLFNADSHSFLSRTNKTTATTFGVSSSLNGYGYYASGTAGSGASLILEQFSPSLNSWSNKATMLNQHSDASGGPLNGFLYAVGSGVGGTSANDQYNDAANTWLARASTISVSTDRAIFDSSGRIMLSSATGNNQEFYKDSTNVWTSLGTFPFGVQSGPHCSSINNNGIMAGGNNPAYATTTYRFIPAIQNIVLGAALRVGE